MFAESSCLVSQLSTKQVTTQELVTSRKKYGELLRPILRPSIKHRSVREPSKSVHFDSPLESVQDFYQFDRPSAVRACDGSISSDIPKWSIVAPELSFQIPSSLSPPVAVERVLLSSNNRTLIGVISVANLSFQKTVAARFTFDFWKTTSEVMAEYSYNVQHSKHTDSRDRFDFTIDLAGVAKLETKTMFFCVRYCVLEQEYWDNNNSANFQIQFNKSLNQDQNPPPVKFDKHLSPPDTLHKPTNLLEDYNSTMRTQQLAFTKRYNFEISLYTTMRLATQQPKDRPAVMKSKFSATRVKAALDTTSSVPFTSHSEYYNSLVANYCFFKSGKHSPQYVQ